jgi:D-alanyl-D-alanine carboxypeptidase
VRLADEDAKKVFDAVTIGTPILVYEKDFILDTFTYTESKPTLGAVNYLSADMRNNFVFLEQNESIQIPLGGLTKLMTALVATEYINIEKSVSVTKESLVPTQKPRLRSGMNTTIYQLLFPLLRESSNEAAEAIANSYGRASFINHMNAKAKSIGMTHTIFADPSGVSEANLSTLEDIFMMSKYIYNNRSFIFNITSGTVKTNTYGKSIFQDLGNANSLVERDYFFGGVEGSLGASTGYNLAVFEVPVIGSSSSTRPLFFLSMNSGTPRTDVIGGLLYVLNKFK